MNLSRDQILQSNDTQAHEVDAHEWGSPGDTVLVRPLTLKEGNEWRRSMLKPVVKVDPKSRQATTELEFNQEAAELANAWMLTIACVDEKGNRLFTEKDIDALSRKSLAPISRIVKVVMRISGLSADAAEDAEKN